MSNSFGSRYKITIFGQSHSKAMGVIIDGLPAGIKLNEDLIKRELDRRKPGRNKFVTKRKEEDDYTIESGLVDGYTCGAPLCFLIENKNKISSDYDYIRENPRPSHSDYPAFIKHKGFNDFRGGGAFSGRLTAALTIAGAIAKDILSKNNIFVASKIKSIYNIEDEGVDSSKINYSDLKDLYKKDIEVINEDSENKIKELIEKLSKEKDSVGGIIEVFTFGLPVGIGEPIFDSLESTISKLAFSVPAINSLEFGLGFESSRMLGSKNNDEYYYDNGLVKTKTNNHGGSIGGLSTGMPLIFRAGIKPTSSIGKIQNTVNLVKKENSRIEIIGRHDPCIALRASVVLETVAAISILDLMMMGDFNVFR